MRDLGQRPAADPALSTSQEDQARLAFESGTSAFMVNYPFVYPSARENTPDLFEHLQWAHWPAVYEGEPSRVTIGGFNLGVGAYSEHPDLAFEAAACIVEPEHQLTAAIDGGLPPTNAALYDDPEIREQYPFADLHPGGRCRTARSGRVTPDLQRHLAGDRSAPCTRSSDIDPECRRWTACERPSSDALESEGPPVTAAPSVSDRRARARSERQPGLDAVRPGGDRHAAVTAYPIVYAVWLSLQRYDLRFPDEREFVGLDNYTGVLTDRLWWQTSFTTTVHHRW